MKRRNLHPLLFAFFSFLLLLHALLFWRAKDDALKGLADFSSFYSSAWMVRQGLGHELYDPITQSRAQSTLFPEASSRNGLLPYIHPPFEVLLFLPLTYFSYRAAYFFWMVINIFLLLATAKVMAPHMTDLRSLWTPLPLLLYLGFFPAFIAVLQGQDSIVLLLVFAFVFVNLKEKHDFKAGFILALGLFKFQYTLSLMVPFLLRRRWKVLEGAASSTAILFLVALPVAGLHGSLSYPSFLLNLLKGSTSHEVQNALGIASNTMPNIRGTIEILGSGLLQPNFRKMVIILLSGAAVIWAAAKWRISPVQPGTFDPGFALLIVASVLVSYHLQFHDLTILLIPFSLMLNHSLKSRCDSARWRFLTFGIVALFFFSPLYLWLIQRRMLFLLFIPILFLAAMLNREIDFPAVDEKGSAGVNQEA